MTWIEASGKTLEDAKETAARELGVPVEEMEVEVLEEESKGFLGIGQNKVRIRAASRFVESVPDDEPDPIDDPQMEEETAGEQAAELLGKILRAMDFDAIPKIVSETDEEIRIDITGESEDIGRLIGRHGQTLDALQYLLSIAVNRNQGQRLRILLDAEGYRDRHQQMLESRARELARKVKETGQEAVLEPQSPRDRRIIHVALMDDPDVETYSEGEGDYRHVVISPKKK